MELQTTIEEVLPQFCSISNIENILINQKYASQETNFNKILYLSLINSMDGISKEILSNQEIINRINAINPSCGLEIDKKARKIE
ncbi:MAG: hypothetical protein PG981_000343 [Wolbachia endosymbiont of Ctenocephalides orientis wCori]|nr:MAG: hypothetical protein PG981_000343 [Wolbachia endosymbiont of Ctenocephalides orientis wCori]